MPATTSPATSTPIDRPRWVLIGWRRWMAGSAGSSTSPPATAIVPLGGEDRNGARSAPERVRGELGQRAVVLQLGEDLVDGVGVGGALGQDAAVLLARLEL